MKIATRNVKIEQRPDKQPIKGLRKLSMPLILLILSVLLCVVILVAVSFGSTRIPMGTIAQILLNGTGIFHFARGWDPTAEIIICRVRLLYVLGKARLGPGWAG